ncbi:hypothetical protein [Lentzea kentuckyensis]|uniref:hypothetical protein n=1 Tax=Lentzea kentuckyensis TaxID=360086 RepID=UPI001302CB5E|nr:hypothetical protein [Lentzea kentuckyensis]
MSADESDTVSRFVSEVPQWISQPDTSQYVANPARLRRPVRPGFTGTPCSAP